MPTPARPCQGRCGYFVLSGTHCCSACKIKNGRHGPLCKKYIPPEEAFRSLADELPVVPSAGDKTTTDETLSSRPLTPTNASADAPTSRHVTPTKAPADNMAATTTPPASVTPRSSPPPSAEPPRSSWYPGKNLHVAYQRTKEWRAQIREAKQRGAFQPARRPLKNLRNVLRQKRPLRERSGEGIGQLHLTVVGGRFRTKRAYVIAELDGNECRTDVATCDTPSWDASFSFAVHDPSSDLRLFLYDDELGRNERPIGRVILPLAQLCEGSMLPRPSASARRLLVRLMPCSTQHNDSLLAR